MDIRRMVRCVTTLAVFAWCSGARATNLLNLKDTLTVLPEYLRELSLFHGAVAWHSGAIMNMYDHGVPAGEPLIPRVKNEDETEEVFVKRKQEANAAFKTWESAIESPIIKDIVRKLFYRVPGTTSGADFKVANAETRVFNRNNNLYIKNATQRLVQLLYRYTIEPYIIGFQKYGKSKNILKNYNENLKNVLLLPKNIETIEDDCFFGSSQDQIRAEIVIRLGQLWALIGHDRSLIKNYYEDLKSTLAKVNLILAKALVIIGFDKVDKVSNYLLSWDGDITFDVSSRFESKASIQSYLLQFNNVSGNEPDNALRIQEAASCLLLLKELKPMSTVRIGYKNGAYVYANCSDTVVRNIINYITLDKTGEFNVSLIEGILGENHKVSESLRQFYAAYPSPLNQGELSVHSAWENVVSNLEFVEYAKAFDGSGLLNRNTEKGFIKLPGGFDPQRFIDEGFTVVDSHVECFEVRSTAHNLIVILDHILQLQLFNQEPLQQEYFRTGFVVRYLPKVFEKIGWVAFVRNDNDIFSFNLNLNDTLMSSIGHAYSTLNITFRIRQHGAFDPVATNQNMDMSMLINMLKQNPFYSLLFVIPVDKWFDVFSELNKSFALYLWSYVAAVDSVRILEQDNLYKRGINLQEYILLKKIVDSQADELSRPWYLMVLESLWFLRMRNFSEESVFTKVFEVASIAVEEGCQVGVELFKELFKQASTQSPEMRTEVFTKALELASFSIEEGYQVGVELFKELFKQASTQSPEMRTEVFTKALEIASDVVIKNCVIGINLFKKLVKYSSTQSPETRTEVFTRALEVASGTIKKNRGHLNFIGLELFKELVKYSSTQSPEMQIEIFTKALESACNMETRGNSIGVELFNEVLKQAATQSPEMQIEVFTIALERVSYLGASDWHLGVKLFNEVLKQISNLSQAMRSRVFTIAFEKASVAVTINFYLGIGLFKSLLEQASTQFPEVRTQVLTKILEVASDAIYSGNNSLLNVVIDLFRVLLVNKDTEVRQLVTEHIQQLLSDKSLKESAKTSLQYL